MKKCIDQGLSITACDSVEFSLLVYALHCACPHRRIRAVRYLLARDIDCLPRDDVTGRDALLWATHNNLEREALCILQNGCVDLSGCDVYGYSALHYAVYHRMERLIAAACNYAEKYVLSVDVPTSGAIKTAITPYVLARRLQHTACADILVNVGGANVQQHDLVPQSSASNLMLFGFHDDDWSKREFRLPNENDSTVSSLSRGSNRSTDTLVSGKSAHSSNRLSLHLPVSYSITKPAIRVPKTSLNEKTKTSKNYSLSTTGGASHTVKPSVYGNSVASKDSSPRGSDTERKGQPVISSPRETVPSKPLPSLSPRGSNASPRRLSNRFDSRLATQTLTSSRVDEDNLLTSSQLRGINNKNNTMISQMMCILSDETRPSFARSAPRPDHDTLNRGSYPWPKPGQLGKGNTRIKQPSFVRAAKRVSNVAYVMRRASAKGNRPGGGDLSSSSLLSGSMASGVDSLRSAGKKEVTKKSANKLV